MTQPTKHAPPAQSESSSPAASSDQPVTSQAVYDCLRQVIDPELNIDVVSLGLIYTVDVKPVPNTANDTEDSEPAAAADRASTTDGAKATTTAAARHHINITMTLTTPGCPLAAVFDGLVKDQLKPLPGVEPDRDVTVELTFDPPWVPDMISEEARAELGL